MTSPLGDNFADRFGEWALVTGAAKGIGLSFVDALRERGMAVVLVDLDPSVIEVATGLSSNTALPPAIGVVADCADPEWVTQVATEIGDRELGLVVANAGVSVIGPFLALNPGQRRAMVDVNCTATLDLAAWALPSMVERGRGAFIATSSGSALAGTAAVGVYSATKAFILNFCEAISWELKDTGVAVQAVVAPSMDTPGFRSSEADGDALLAVPSDPADVVAISLDRLGDGAACCLTDPGLEFMAEVPRGERSRILSEVTHAMYADRF